MPMKLLLDLGNTRIKWQLIDNQCRPCAAGAAGWHEDLGEQIGVAWNRLPAINQVWAASVVTASHERRVQELLREHTNQRIQWLRTPTAACGVSNGYAEPSQLGIDRFLAMVAAHAEHPGPWVLVGVGTALTLDALDARGRHLGGLIAPGPRLMQQSVLEATARVNLQRQGEQVMLAQATEDALASGCRQASLALIERFYHQMHSHFGIEPQLCLSGGDAASLLDGLSIPAILRIDSVLQGLAICSAEPARLNAGARQAG